MTTGLTNNGSALYLSQGSRSRKVLSNLTPCTPGSGISSVSTAVYWSKVGQVGGLIETLIYIDLEGLNSGGADGDIIGKNGTANCHLGQITTAVNGRIVAGSISCLETPTGGEPDIDVYSAVEATGTEDAAVSGLTETALLAKAADWVTNTKSELTVFPAADEYLYLVASGGVTDATYTAGRFLIRLLGTEV